MRYYLFEVLFDYGDLPALPSIPYNPLEFDKLIDEWPLREDPFSSFRSGFEIRTLRRCKRILMLHHIAGGELIGAPLVKSTNFEYSINKDTNLSMLRSVKVIGYMKSKSNGYVSSEMPPVSLNYSEFKPYRQKFQSVSVNGNDFPPMALSDPNYTLIDLFGNGLPDILCTTENAYYYWRNLGDGCFERRNVQQNMPSGVILSSPNIAIGDIGGDGLADIIVRTPEISGFYEATPIGSWKPYKKFDHIPSFDLSDSNVQLVDLIGNGLSDAIVSQETNFLWYRCLGETGYDEPRLIPRIYDLNEFPNVYFNDPEGRIRFADMNGDGLSDIVMIHNGRIDYWANLGYGRFSRRLTMANFPHFDHTFNLKRLFLVDLDGSGCDDLVYVDFNEVHFWFNQSGNNWSEKKIIYGTPYITDVSSVQFADIFGIGLKSLVWSYNFDEQPDGNYKILDFCGGVKPYLLNEMNNNMGATTRVKYAPSTKFYLEDLKNGSHWISNLPFPVQVVEKTEKIDHISKLKLVNSYKYHHGYYSGSEREFRGFGQVDQYDTEEYEVFANTSLHSDTRSFINKQKDYYIPPILTKTWFHLGVYFDENLISANNQFFENADIMESYHTEFFDKDNYAFKLEDHRVETDEIPHEAYRTLRGSNIRTEIYALDKTNKHNFPYIITENKYNVKLIQNRNGNKNAVFYPFLSESLVFHYERNYEDPRINHRMILNIDEYGNITDSVSIIYPRRPHKEIYEEQNVFKVTYTYSKFINEDNFNSDHDNFYYIGLPCETKVFEVRGINWKWDIPLQKTVHPLRTYDFSSILGSSNFKPFDYNLPKTSQNLEKRLIQWNRVYYRKNENPFVIDEIGNLSHRLPLGKIDVLALLYESYEVVFTDSIINDVFGENKLNLCIDGGYHPHQNHPNAEINAFGYWWIPSGRHAYNPHKFYQIEKIQDPFGEITNQEFDSYGLMVQRIEDAWSFKHIKEVDKKHLTISKLNYRVLKPEKVIEANGNISEVKFNPLGMVIATARRGIGKNGEIIGDYLSDLGDDLEEEIQNEHIINPLLNPSRILKKASSRIIIDLNRFLKDGSPNLIYTLSRVNYSSESESYESEFQHKYVYIDGFGREIQAKLYVGSGFFNGEYVPIRWLGTGTKIFNNKGKKVQQFEPFFSKKHNYGIEKHGVSSILFYDPLERLICTLNPNHTYEKTVIKAWSQEIWDANDNIHHDFRYNPQFPEILPDHNYNPIDDPHIGHYFREIPPDYYLPTWYDLRVDKIKASKIWDTNNQRTEENSAKNSAKHSATPIVYHSDGLSHNFLTIADNGKDSSGEDMYLETKTKWDINGNSTEIIDPLGKTLYIYKYDIFGNNLLTISSDSGSRKCFFNVFGKPIHEWDSNNYKIKIIYDELQRPIAKWVQKGGKSQLVEKTIYGDGILNAKQNNLIGQKYKVYDGAGLLIFHNYDFKNNLLHKTRRVIKNSEIEKKFEIKGEPFLTVDWNLLNENILDPKTYTIYQEFDALSRLKNKIFPDNSILNIYYNERNSVKKIAVNGKPIIKDIVYNEKGQRIQILYGNDVQTKFDYDPVTFRMRRLWTRMSNRTGKILQDLSYFYDPMGNILKVEDKAKLGERRHVIERLLEQNREYIYDSLYKLICAKGKECNLTPEVLTYNPTKCSDPNATRTYYRKYKYDKSGNIVRITHKAIAQGKLNNKWIKDFVYGDGPSQENNRLKKVITKQGEKEFSFDSNGNMISNAQNQHFYWNHSNSMIGVIINNSINPSNKSMHTQYFYDIDGIRVKKVVKCGTLIKTTIYIDNIYEEFLKVTNEDLREHTIYKHVMDGTNRIAKLKDIIYETKPDNEPSVIYYHCDIKNSSQIITDLDGNLFNQEEYFPYGETSFGGYAKKRYRHAGKECDKETGLYYYGQRYYAPYLRRWLNCDPAGPADGLNTYIYNKNNPIIFHDPTGLETESEIILGEKRDDVVDAMKELQNIVGKGDPSDEAEIARRIGEFNKLDEKTMFDNYQGPLLEKLRVYLQDTSLGSYTIQPNSTEGTLAISTHIGDDGIVYNVIATNGDTNEKQSKWGQAKIRIEKLCQQSKTRFRVKETPKNPKHKYNYKTPKLSEQGKLKSRRDHAEAKLFEDLDNANIAEGTKVFLAADRKMCVTCKMVKEQFIFKKNINISVYEGNGKLKQSGPGMWGKNFPPQKENIDTFTETQFKDTYRELLNEEDVQMPGWEEKVTELWKLYQGSLTGIK